MKPQSQEQTTSVPTDQTAPETPAAVPSCGAVVPNGFEEFDLNDIEVIESKVFA